MRLYGDLKEPTLIELEPIGDERGYFMRHFDASLLGDFKIMQANVCFNKKGGTIRGLHYQVAPFEETKIVSCLKGSIIDFAVDIREDSETYLMRWHASLGLYRNRQEIFYIPPGFAHGYQTLEDNTLVHYYMSQEYNKEAERCLKYNDPRLTIEWPFEEKILSERDNS